MDVEILSRIQFAVTIMFHYIYPPLSIGLGLNLVFIEGAYLWTKKQLYLDAAKFWTRVFALTFAMGVATGIVMEFEFGTNWATYSRYVGDVFGSALAAEGVFAFMLESGFLALLLFGWNRIGPKLHFFSTLMVCLGAHFSAVWIVVANSWMQTPAGYHVVGEGIKARAEIIDFWAMVFNPSSMDRLIHVIFGTWLAGSFLIISVCAYYLLKKRHLDFARASMKIALTIASITIVAQAISGDSSGKTTAKYQPAKLAALEGLFHSQEHAPMYLFGYVDLKERKVIGPYIPSLLSFLAFKSVDAEVMGLDAIPEKDWPNVVALFPIYRVMVGMWFLMFLTSIIAIWKWRRKTLFGSNWALKLLVISVLFPQLANQTGWMSAEMGRYPWIVYNELRISEGLSKIVTANQVLGSLIMFALIYFCLFMVFLYLLNSKIKTGPETRESEIHYHAIQALFGKSKDKK